MTPLRKHSGKPVFPLADTLRFLTFPSLRFQRKRNTFFTCFRQISVSGIMYFCNRWRLFLLRKREIPYRKPIISFFFRRKREDTPATWLVFPCSRCPYCVNTSKNWVTHLRKPSFPFGIFFNSYMKLTFGYFFLTYMQWRLIHYTRLTNI